MWNREAIEWVDVELTSFCNINCPGCFRQQKREKVNHILNNDYLEFKYLKKWITIENFPKLRLINFCGSIDEPTTHPEFLNIVDHFSNLCEISISSNASTKNESFWKKLGAYGVNVFFGIDGIDQESLEKYRVGSNFKKIKQNWRSFIAAGGQATWQYIVFDHNEHLIEEAKKIATEEGFCNFRLIYSHRDTSNESKKIQRKEESQIICKYANQNRIFISHTGVLLPCCFFNSEYLQFHANNDISTMFIDKFKKVGGKLMNNLKYAEPSEIIDGDLFKEIVKSWNHNPIDRCSRTCKQSKQDIFIQEKL